MWLSSCAGTVKGAKPGNFVLFTEVCRSIERRSPLGTAPGARAGKSQMHSLICEPAYLVMPERYTHDALPVCRSNIHNFPSDMNLSLSVSSKVTNTNTNADSVSSLSARFSQRRDATHPSSTGSQVRWSAHARILLRRLESAIPSLFPKRCDDFTARRACAWDIAKTR